MGITWSVVRTRSPLLLILILNVVVLLLLLLLMCDDVVVKLMRRRRILVLIIIMRVMMLVMVIMRGELRVIEAVRLEHDNLVLVAVIVQAALVRILRVVRDAALRGDLAGLLGGVHRGRLVRHRCVIHHVILVL